MTDHDLLGPEYLIISLPVPDIKSLVYRESHLTR
jgi:hypothetical protein